MADQKRLESSATPEAADRDSRTESLLVDGLDRYFNGRYDEAIHLWTRVLFLDRSHARARAYIDRARTALAERQRRTEEMLHRTSDLLTAGQIDQARVLLAQAVATGGDDERAAELGLRLDRLDRVRAGQGAPHPPAVVDAVPLGRPLRTGPRLALTMAVVAGAVLIGVVASPIVERWMTDRAAAPAGPAAGAAVSFPVPSSSEAALIRARTLYARGRLAEALGALDRVGAESPQWPVADQLRVEIQQILLANRRGLSSSRAGGDTGR